MAIKKKTASGTIIKAEFAKENLIGTTGNDTLIGGSGNNMIDGKGGNDVAYGHAGDDYIFNVQRAFGGTGNDRMMGGDGDDDLHGGKGADVLATSFGSDRLFGDSGNDTALLRTGSHYASGGSGFDTLDLWHNGLGWGWGTSGPSGTFVKWSEGEGVTVNLSKHFATGQSLWFSQAGPGSTYQDVHKNKALGTATASKHFVTGFEAVRGTDLADSLTGDKRANLLKGEGGNDMLRGLGGADTLTGGAGSDTFVYLKKDVTGPGKADHITDFAAGDKLDLRDFFKGRPAVSLESMVHVTDKAAGLSLSVNVEGAFYTVATLDNVYGVSVSQMLKDGWLIV